MASDQTTPVWPESTPETRSELGCFGKEVGNYAECWCGYAVDETHHGTCPECKGMLRATLLFKKENNDAAIQGWEAGNRRARLEVERFFEEINDAQT